MHKMFIVDLEIRPYAPPEQVLWLAVIDQAFRDVMHFRVAPSINLKDRTGVLAHYNNAKAAQKWIHDPRGSIEKPQSFIWAAHVGFHRLEYSPEEAIQNIKATTKIDIEFSASYLAPSYNKDPWEY